jgi:hypothetical protein
MSHQFRSCGADIFLWWQAEDALEKGIPDNNVEFLSERARMFSEKIAPLFLSGCTGIKSICVEEEIGRNRPD